LNLNDPRQFFISFVLLWIAVGFIVAQLSGWAELAHHYRATNRFEGRKLRFRSSKMRLNMQYNNCLTVGLNAQTMYLAVLLPFRIGHPPLTIPWNEVTTATGKTLWWTWTEFRFQQAPSVWIRFYGKLGEEHLFSSQTLPATAPQFIQA
jgi:hypothetical protein